SVNVDGVFNVTQAVLPDMLSRKSGSIVNLSSVWGRYGASGEVAYSATKAAVIGFTKALAKEVALCGVRVNAVAPGAIDTDMMKVYSEEEVEALIRESIPLGRLGKAEEVAGAILFAAENEYVTGAVIPVDGLLC
ncbi:MAG: SDR family oxidoreductase, partial [Clostridia bacterium]|nr:SDR family oxidoreductase [Clostridia bacterium]